MNTLQTKIWERLPLINKGVSKLFVFRRSFLNLIFQKLNALCGMTAGPGITINKTEGNVMLSVDAATLPNAVGGLRWKGVYSGSAYYTPGDIVLLDTDAFIGGRAGTFHCKAKVNGVAPITGTSWTDYWEYFDKINQTRHKLDDLAASTGEVDINLADINVPVDETNTYHDVKFRKYPICIWDSGTSEYKTYWVILLGSLPFGDDGVEVSLPTTLIPGD